MGAEPAGGEQATVLVHASASTHQHGYVSNQAGEWSSILTYQLRRDGFAFATPASPSSGSASLTTKPLVWQAGALSVNVDCAAAADAHIVVSIIDPATGVAIPGYTAAQAHPFSGNSTDSTVAWSSGATMQQLAGKQVAVAVTMRGTVKLYSFRGAFVWA